MAADGLTEIAAWVRVLLLLVPVVLPLLELLLELSAVLEAGFLSLVETVTLMEPAAAPMILLSEADIDIPPPPNAEMTVLSFTYASVSPDMILTEPDPARPKPLLFWVYATLPLVVTPTITWLVSAVTFNLSLINRVDESINAFVSPPILLTVIETEPAPAITGLFLG